MKSFLAIVSVCIAISIGCSGSRSASSPAMLANTASPLQAFTPPVVSSTQDKPICDLSMSHAGANGLKLGMTKEEVLALFPDSRKDAELSTAISTPPSSLGTLIFVIRPQKYANQAEFKGISQVTFALLDNRVATLTVGYNGPQYAHVDKFVETIIQGTNLPPADQWQPYTGLDEQMKTLTCSEFSVRAFIGGEAGNLNYVMFQDLEADKKLKERRKKAREQASPTPGQ
jgi:hypothetical protein